MERRLIEGLAVPPGPGGGTRRVAPLPLSLVIHTAVLGLVVLVPILTTEELPPLATRGDILVAATLVPPPPPPRGVPLSEAVDGPRRAPAPAPPARGTVLSLPTSSSDLPPAEGPGWGLTDLPVCEGCVPWGVDGGVPLDEAALPAGLPDEPVLRVSDGIQPPVKLSDVRPEYPELAIRAGVEGVVIIECRVDTRGHVVDTRVLRGHPLLTRAALDAVRQWRYRPTLLNGHPVSVIMTVTVRFQLRR
jgi:protein TonB